MALVVKDRVKEAASNPGTGTVTLSGAVAGFRSFGDIGSGNTTYYVIFDIANSLFEVGEGTYTDNTGGGGNRELARNEVLQNSSGNTSKINFTGSVEVFVALPASKSVHKNNTDNLELTGDFTITSGSATDQIVMKNTNTGTDAAPDLVLWRDSASPANSDSLGRIDFRGEDDGSTARNYTSIESKIVNVAASTPTGAIHFKTLNASTSEADVLVLSGNTATFSNTLDVGTITTSALASLRLKTAGSNNALAINIEENSGNEGWGLGVNAAGDLKFYNSTAGTITGNSAVTFSDDDKVGIGTASPVVPLHIDIGSDNNAIYAQSSDQYCNIGLIDGSGSGKIIMDSGKLLFTSGGNSSTSFTGSTTKVTIDTSGNVGIGDTSPSNRLSVVAADGDSDNAYVATFQNQEATNDRNFGVLIKAGSTATDSALVVADHDASNNLFFVKGNGKTFIAGDVGIATTTIGDKLVVQGATNATQSIVIQDPTANDYGTHLSYDDANSKAIFGGLTNGTKNPTLRVARDATSGIDIDSSGRVGIGTASPAQKLTVASEGRLRLQRADNARYGDIYNDNSFLNIVTSNDPIRLYGQGYIRFDIGGAEKVRINSSGDITTAATVQATRYYVDGTSKFIDGKSGNYGTIRVEGDTHAGYAIRDDFVFMAANSDYCGIYNDTDNEWQALFYRNGRVELRDNGTETFRTDGNGIWVRSRVTSSDGVIYLGSNAHAQIYNDEGTAMYLRNGANENFIYGAENSYTYLYWNATWTLRTNSNGIQVRSTSNNADGTITIGSSEHAKIVNDAGSYLGIRTDGDEYGVYCQENGYTYLYYNGSWSIRAASGGITINGRIALGANDNAYGSSGQVLTSNGSSDPSWQDAGGGAWEVIGNYTGTATGTNATVDFVHGSGGFVHDATTYKHHKMYATLWNTNGATGNNYVSIYPLVGTTSSYAPMSALCARHQNWNLVHPEFTGVTYNQNKWGYGVQSFANNQGAVAYYMRLYRSATTGNSVGLGAFSETISGTTRYSGDRFFPTVVELDFASKGIDSSFGMTGQVYYKFDTGLFDNFTYYTRWMLMGLGYGKVGWRLYSHTNNANFNYDITWIGLKP